MHFASRERSERVLHHGDALLHREELVDFVFGQDQNVQN
jgi:hypothetical protein